MSFAGRVRRRRGLTAVVLAMVASFNAVWNAAITATSLSSERGRSGGGDDLPPIPARTTDGDLQSNGGGAGMPPKTRKKRRNGRGGRATRSMSTSKAAAAAATTGERRFPRIVTYAVDYHAAANASVRRTGSGRRKTGGRRRRGGRIEDDGHHPHPSPPSPRDDGGETGGSGSARSANDDEECDASTTSSWRRDSHHPNCNTVHEVDVRGRAMSDDLRYVASGAMNDVYRLELRRDDGDAAGGRRPTTPSPHSSSSSTAEEGESLALKLLSPTQKHRMGMPSSGKYTPGNYDTVRADVLVQERLTRSPRILPVYGHCGLASIVPWADGGTLDAALKSKRAAPSSEGGAGGGTRGGRGGAWGWRNASSSATRLAYAIDASAAVADLHDAGVVHADLTVRQFVIRNGGLQLGDFNRGILLERNLTAARLGDDGSASWCTFRMTSNYGVTRAPEEYRHVPQTRAVDVWSLGSIIHHLLTGSKVWSGSGLTKSQVQDAVAGGRLPEVDRAILRGSDPVDAILKRAIDMCYVYEPSERATAREVASFLQSSREGLRLEEGSEGPVSRAKYGT